MSFYREIMNEDHDCPSHICKSVLSAMSLTKEVAADDEIYHKIHRGSESYSKFQIDKAVAKALSYGIFEVKHNRYKVKDDIFEDEDAFYWKFPEKRDRTPLRIEERLSERQWGPKLDPETDNQKFRKMSSPVMRECPNCGRTRKLIVEKRRRKCRIQRKLEKYKISKNTKNKKFIAKNLKASCRNSGLRRKKWQGRKGKELSVKRKKSNKKSKEKESFANDTLSENVWSGTKDLREESSTDLYLESSTEENKTMCTGQKKSSPPLQSPQRDTEKKRSNVFKSNSGGVKKDGIAHENFQGCGDFRDSVVESEKKKTFADNESETAEMQYSMLSEEYHNPCDSGQKDQYKRKSDWLGLSLSLSLSGEHQGVITQSSKVLTIEPMDSLTFKIPEPAIYIS